LGNPDRLARRARPRIVQHPDRRCRAHAGKLGQLGIAQGTRAMANPAPIHKAATPKASIPKARGHMSDWDRDAALTTARILLEIKAVNFRPEEPYTFTSGWKSP